MDLVAFFAIDVQDKASGIAPLQDAVNVSSLSEVTRRETLRA
jgi:hypothetical protein